MFLLGTDKLYITIEYSIGGPKLSNGARMRGVAVTQNSSWLICSISGNIIIIVPMSNFDIYVMHALGAIQI